MAILSTFAAHAQPAPDRRDAPVRIQAAINFFIPGPATDGDDARLRQARRTLYELAGRECELLREILAKDCRLEGVNVNVNRQTSHQYGQQVEGYMVNGNFNLQIILK